MNYGGIGGGLKYHMPAMLGVGGSGVWLNTWWFFAIITVITSTVTVLTLVRQLKRPHRP